MVVILDADVIIRGEKGTMAGYYDVMAAATARHRNNLLAPFSRKHIQHIAGLHRVLI